MSQQWNMKRLVSYLAGVARRKNFTVNTASDVNVLITKATIDSAGNYTNDWIHDEVDRWDWTRFSNAVIRATSRYGA